MNPSQLIQCYRSSLLGTFSKIYSVWFVWLLFLRREKPHKGKSFPFQTLGWYRRTFYKGETFHYPQFPVRPLLLSVCPTADNMSWQSFRSGIIISLLLYLSCLYVLLSRLEKVMIQNLMFKVRHKACLTMFSSVSVCWQLHSKGTVTLTIVRQIFAGKIQSFQ